MFNPEDYEPVAVRLDRWLKTAADPRVITQLVEYGPEYCVFRAELYEAEKLIATGWAEERRSDRGITSNSMVEVCETSAIGRALANCGMAGSDPGKRASREEMQKATRPAQATNTSGTGSTRPASEKQINAIKAMSKKAGRTTPPGLDEFTAEQASQAIQKLQDMLDGVPQPDGASQYYNSKPSGGFTGD
jgi:hypothetical protein